PGLRHKPVTHLDLDRGGYVLETEPADERAIRLGRPDAQAGKVRIVVAGAQKRGSHRRARRDRTVADVAHHPWIAIEPIQILDVFRAEFAQRQPLGGQEWLGLVQLASPSAASCSAWNSWASAAVSSNKSPSMIWSIL